MFSRFCVRNREEEMQSGLFRIAVSMYSETAFREALLVKYFMRWPGLLRT
jgi:hypothetical protein